jgi:uncharacterized membrane protein (GlpM family)
MHILDYYTVPSAYSIYPLSFSSTVPPLALLLPNKVPTFTMLTFTTPPSLLSSAPALQLVILHTLCPFKTCRRLRAASLLYMSSIVRAEEFLCLIYFFCKHTVYSKFLMMAIGKVLAETIKLINA